MDRSGDEGLHRSSLPFTRDNQGRQHRTNQSNDQGQGEGMRKFRLDSSWLNQKRGWVSNQGQNHRLSLCSLNI